MMFDAPLSFQAAESERAAWRFDVLRSLAESGEPLSDAAALAVDVLASTPQSVMLDPCAIFARPYFEVHAEEAGMPKFTRDMIRATLAELDGRDMLPAWVCLEAPGMIGGAL